MNMQCKTILNMLCNKSEASGLDFIYRAGIIRYSARIKELRDMGYKISTRLEMVNDKRIGKYSLEGEL